MCNDHHDTSVFCTIIPPHMLEVMSVRGDKKVRAMAQSMLKQDGKTREERAEQPVGGPAGFAGTRESAATTSAIASVSAAGNLNRKIHDGENKAALPGKLVRKEGDAATGDVTVDAAYDGAGDVFELYATEFGRNSLDDNGMPLVATCHHRRNYNNAFWNGSQMAYGDGDGQIFTGFTELSVIGHEMSHGVVQFSGGLIYQGQSGALNESFADVFGALTLQYKDGLEAHQSDWLIGKGILGPNINGVALRSMKAPGTAYSDALLGQDPQPYHMDFYVQTNQDNGGVHINSGIPNHAFYLYAQYMGGKAWEIPGQIWYRALQTLNNPLATFHDWALETHEAAQHLHGNGSMESHMLRRAWKLVGIQI